MIDREIIITNKKPSETPKYILEADPQKVKEALREFKEKEFDHIETVKAEMTTEEGFVNEALLDEQVNVKQDFRLETSTSSCHMDDVTAFVLGGSTSRWWMMRKHINLMTRKEMNENMPFYSWQCLTL